MGKRANFGVRVNQENNKSYEIKLPLFEGPFDLLLFFIERDELDIYDIPIYKITGDFLDYIQNLEQMNVEVASEFILVAATLMRIKAKTLLPRPVLDEEGNEIDPREELLKHLLEYKRYKSVISELSKLEANRSERMHRGNLLDEIKKLSEGIGMEAEIQDLDLYKLLKAFQKVLKRSELEQNNPVHEVVQYPYSISVQKEYIINRLLKESGHRLSFEKLISEKPKKILAICNFLAILELLQLGMITIHIGEGYNNFWINKA